MCRFETKSAFVLAVACTLLTFPFAPVRALANDWEQSKHDAARTGTSTASFNPQSLELSWNSPAGYHDVITANGMAYATTAAAIGAFDLNTGALKWTYTLSDRVSPPAYADGLVAFTTNDLTTDRTTLQVVDAQTGRPLYSVPSFHDTTPPTLYHDPRSGELIAYTVDSAYRLTPSGATKLWGGGQGSYGTQRILTVADSSLVVATPFRYYSIDRATGVWTTFFSGNGDGGGEGPTTYDASRRQLYVTEAYDSVNTALTAWSYENGSFRFLWKRSDAGVGGVSLGLDGSIYSTESSAALKLDPTDGHTTQSTNGQTFGNSQVPIVTDRYLWELQTNSLALPKIAVFDRQTLQLVATIPVPGTFGDPLPASAVLDDSHLVVDYVKYSSLKGFSVYRSLPGDVNKDGVTGFDDLVKLAQNYGATGATFAMGDLTGDGTVGFDDLLLLAQHYGEQLHSTSATAAAVPEPASIVLLPMATAVSCRRRRN